LLYEIESNGTFAKMERLFWKGSDFFVSHWQIPALKIFQYLSNLLSVT